MERPELILVDADDNETGTCGKLEAHQKGLLHRAFSIFIFDQNGNMLLQQRATEKYHSGGLWTNACCSHPQPGEKISDAAVKRLDEELGIHTPLKEVFDFVYRAEMENGLVEHEFDHVLTGEYEGPVPFNENEVQAICFKPMMEIKNDLKTAPSGYTIWFHLAFEKIEQWWQGQYGNL